MPSTGLPRGSSSVQQQALRHFRQAFKNWWAGTHRRPTWRRRAVNDGFCIRDVRVRKLSRRRAAVVVPKHGDTRASEIRFRLSRPLPAGKLGMARVTLDGKGRWHVSFPRRSQPSSGSERAR